MYNYVEEKNDINIIKLISQKYRLTIPQVPLDSMDGTIGYCIDKDKRIVELRINQKKLGKFPEEILELDALKKLQLTRNEISIIPHGIDKLVALRALYLTSNQITELPTTLSSLKGLRSLRLQNNPINTPPPEIIKQGLKAILEFLASKDFKALNELKVILVGDGSSGKTSVLKRILHDDFNESEEKTHGIIIEKQNMKISGSDYRVNFWDFGGQEIMHSTHQFFLTKRSLYLLLLDGRKEEDPEYWLKHIKTFGGNSPVIVILNKYDDNPSFEVNRRFLLDKYPNIREFIKISCKTRHNINELIDLLKKEIISIEHISTLWPLKWFNIKHILEETKANYISFEKYREICNTYDLNETSKQKSLIEFLNDLGTVLHFDDMFLSETNVINPRWITSAVYSIINSEHVFINKGILRYSELENILDRDEYISDKYGYIIGLMKKFELCYSINNDSVLIPDLLDVQEPEFAIEKTKSLEFIYEYDFLPLSVMPRFIVKSNLEIYGDLKWRTGVILYEKDYDAYAIVKCDYNDSLIDIIVTGENKIEYLSVIRSRINEINKSFQNIKLYEKIPCNCQVCKKIKNPILF